MRFICLLLMTTPLLIGGMARPAEGIVQFYMVYKAEYLDKHPDKKYAAEVNKAAVRCFVCHQGKLRKHHNPFGKHLVPLLDRKKDLRDKEKIAAAIKKVVDMRVDPKNEKSEKYIDRIKASKWPGGELEDLKKEPPKDAEQ